MRPAEWLATGLVSGIFTAAGICAAGAKDTARAEPPRFVEDAGDARTLADYRWRNRVLVIAAPRDGYALVAQLDAFSGREDGLAERDLVVIQVSDGDAVPLFGDDAAPGADSLGEAFDLDPDTEFTLVLVGKDGGEKLRAGEPVAADDLFALIDAMPMRAREIKAKR